MYKSFGVHCDIHTRHPYVGGHDLSPDAFGFGHPTLYFWLRACPRWAINIIWEGLVFILSHNKPSFSFTQNIQKLWNIIELGRATWNKPAGTGVDLSKILGGQTKILGAQSDKCMGVSQLLGGTCPGCRPKVYARGPDTALI